MNLWSKVIPHFTLKEIIFYQNTKNNLIFVLIINHSTPSPFKNPENDAFEDIHSNSPPPDDTKPFEHLQSHTS